MSKSANRYEQFEHGDFKITVSYKNNVHTGTVFYSSRLLYQESGKDRAMVRQRVLDWCSSPELIEEVKTEKLIRFLERQGITLDEGNQRFRKATHNRVNHCWQCQNEVTSFTNPECRKCGWLACGCSACGCGYSFSTW